MIRKLNDHFSPEGIPLAVLFTNAMHGEEAKAQTSSDIHGKSVSGKIVWGEQMSLRC